MWNSLPGPLPSVTTKGFLYQHLLFLEPEGFKDPQAMFHPLSLGTYQSCIKVCDTLEKGFMSHAL